MTTRLIHGEALATLRTLPDASVDAVVTDPPYFLPARHSNTRKDFPRSLSDLSMLEYFYRDCFEQFARVLKRTGFMYVFCDGQSYPVFYALAYRHVRRQCPLVWDKQVSINGFSWRHQHELILFAEMEESPAVKTGDGDVIRCRAVAVESREHPAEKPLPLMGEFVKKGTPLGGVVLDPFMGSGATGAACIRYGRSFIGVEQDAHYFAVARRRIEEAEAHRDGTAGELFAGLAGPR